MVTKAAVVSVEEMRGAAGLNSPPMFRAYYRILKRGRKPLRYTYKWARDELEAWMLTQEWLRERGYKV